MSSNQINWLSTFDNLVDILLGDFDGKNKYSVLRFGYLNNKMTSNGRLNSINWILSQAIDRDLSWRNTWIFFSGYIRDLSAILSIKDYSIIVEEIVWFQSERDKYFWMYISRSFLVFQISFLLFWSIYLSFKIIYAALIWFFWEKNLLFLSGDLVLKMIFINSLKIWCCIIEIVCRPLWSSWSIVTSRNCN